MDKTLRSFLIIITIVASVFLALKFALPLFANLFVGLGVDLPFPLSRLSPQYAIPLFFFTCALATMALAGLITLLSRLFRPK